MSVKVGTAALPPLPERTIGALGGGESTDRDHWRRESYRGSGIIDVHHPFVPRGVGTLCARCLTPVDDWRHLRHPRQPRT